jgi:predicted Fe-Mo cluster-binding NifX family protein
LIAIPVKDNNHDPEIDERFGRATSFCIIDKDHSFKFIDNTSKNLSSGAGGQAVKLLADENVNIIISPHIGPKAMDVIEALEIKVFEKGESKTVSEVLTLFRSNKLNMVTINKSGLRRV